MFLGVDPHPDFKDMMKKLVTLSVAAALLALTAGCSAPASEPAPTPPPPTSRYSGSGETTGPKPNKTLWDYQAPVMTDTAFFAAARAGTTTLTEYSDDKLTIMSQLTCASIGNGETSKELLLKQAVRSATGKEDALSAATAKDVANVLVVGAQNYCPALGATVTKSLA